MINYILVLIAIESVLLTFIVLHISKKIIIRFRVYEILIFAAILLAIIINALIENPVITSLVRKRVTGKGSNISSSCNYRHDVILT